MKTSAYWHIKTIARDLKYLRDISFYLFTKREPCEKPVVRYSKRGNLAPCYDKPVCFFCSYDKENTIRKNIYHYLNELVRAGFDIVFISSSDTIPDAVSEETIGMLYKNNSQGE